MLQEVAETDTVEAQEARLVSEGDPAHDQFCQQLSITALTCSVLLSAQLPQFFGNHRL